MNGTSEQIRKEVNLALDTLERYVKRGKGAKHLDMVTADRIEALVPPLVETALKLARTRNAQSVSGRDAGLRT